MARARRAALTLSLVGAAAVTPRACRSCEEDPAPPAPFETAYGAADCAADAGRLPPTPGGPDRRPLLPPDPAAVAGAAALGAATPTARVYFARTTGLPLLVHADGRPLAPAGPSDDPLATDALLAALQGLLAAQPDLFRVDDPAAELRAAEVRADPVTGGAVLRAARWWGDRRVQGEHALAWFDRDGALLAVVARLTPTAAVAGTFAPLVAARAPLEAAWDVVDGAPALTVRDHVDAPRGGPRLRRVRAFDPVTGAALAPALAVDARSVVALDPAAAVPAAGEPPPPPDPAPVESPEDWTVGPVRELPAPDPDGVARAVWSTGIPGGWSLGWHGAGYLRGDRWVSVADAEGRLLGLIGLWFVEGDPIATRAATWVDDPVFAGTFPAATDLSRHLRGALEWYAAAFDVQSWDERGGSVSGSVRANPWLIPGGMFNAYSDRGRIAIGGGAVPATGRTLASAPDVIGHELTHSLITTHTDWPYEGETGAVAESFADLMGNAFEGIGGGYELAEATGLAVRDLADPARFGMPATYDDLRVVTTDNGGVHLNSGILARAGVEVWAAHDRDPLPLAGLVVHALRTAPFDATPRIEEVGAALLAGCFAREQAAPEPDGPPVCAPLKRGLCTVRLLEDPGPAAALAR
jgi:hypothetical protein